MAADSKLEVRYEKYKEILKNLTIMSDIFMRNVLKKRECTEYVLQVIMEKKGLKVLDQVMQKDYKNLQGRSAVLDCVVRDADGKQFDVEIQQDSEGASPNVPDITAACWYEYFKSRRILRLPETHVIFITRDDVLGYGLPIYHIGRKIKEIDEGFPDESYIIYVNSSHQDDTELGHLMHDFHCKSAADIQ